MNGIIVNFRQGRHHVYDNHMIVTVEKVDKKEKAEKLIGKKVVFKTTAGKEINGKVVSAHGNKGAIRCIFEKGICNPES